MNKKTTRQASSQSRKSAAATESTDIVELILQDHKPLKKLIKTLKDEEAELSERKAAFKEFAPLLVAHSKPEEESLYKFMKKSEEMKADGFEGDTEHAIADRLIEEIKVARNEDMWTAKAKVLAELVEHHIKEEEKEMLPEFKKEAKTEEREKIGQLFLKLKRRFESAEVEEASPKAQRPAPAMEAPMMQARNRG